MPQTFGGRRRKDFAKPEFFFLCPEIRREDSLPRRKLAFLAKDKKDALFLFFL